MKTAHYRPVKPINKPAKKKAKKSTVRGSSLAVALFVGRALTRKPRVNTALAAIFRANRDLLPK
jgi:hypothetical protein